jgi:hypothetical protein
MEEEEHHKLTRSKSTPGLLNLEAKLKKGVCFGIIEGSSRCFVSSS